MTVSLFTNIQSGKLQALAISEKNIVIVHVFEIIRWV